MTARIERCRICGNSQLAPILSLGEQSLTGLFPRSDDGPVTVAPLELVKCTPANGERTCGLVQLRHSFDSNVMYGANYGYRSSLNPSMVAHLREIVEQLAARVELHPGDLVIDIGSNDGTLLSFYQPGPTFIGVDPTAVKYAGEYRDDAVVLTDFFDAESIARRFPARKAKLITSIAMFYDLADPLHFVRGIESLLADDGLWHFEQSYLPSMMRANAYDTICHEHLEYFSLQQIRWLLERAGLKIVDVATNDTNGGSFAVTAAKASSLHRQTIVNDEDDVVTGLAAWIEFEQRIREHRDAFRSALMQLRAEGQRVIGYGASTKGNVILQYCGIDRELLPCIAEVHPEKVGRVTPGTRIPIISEDEARQMKPDVFVVFPWHFRDFVVAKEREFLCRGGTLLFPLPRVEFVTA